MAILLILGSMAGLFLALAAGPILASIVYQTSPRDPLLLTGVVTILLVVGGLSCWAPARRSVRIEPTVALRTE
jgi:ABC-type lipoprotein release transport system permease subunit